MKSEISGLLAIGERDLINSLGCESLLASNSEAPVREAPVDLDDAPRTSAAPAAPAAQAPAAVLSAGAQLRRSPAAQAASSGAAAADAVEHGAEHDHDHADGICEGLLSEAAWLAAQGGTDLALTSNADVVLGAPLMALDQTFRLHSNPTASRTIYLDFNGHTTTGTSWNTWNSGALGSSFNSPAFDLDANPAAFSDAELILIQRAWQRVAADFAAFDVNVTTQEPLSDWLIKSGSTDLNYGIRTVITSYGPSSGSAGGIAYIDSFNWNSDTPAFVYNTSLLGVSEAISHEVGHTLGLSHDGTFDAATNSSVSYYSGHGSADAGWAPIMGAGYYQNVTQWDDGRYYNSNNSGSSANYGKGADDLAVITGYNGFSYQLDQEGGGTADATALGITAGVVSQFGTIETAADVDVFRFDLVEVGGLDLQFDPYIYRAFVDGDGQWGGATSPYVAGVSDADSRTAYADHGSNLDLSVSLLDAAGAVMATANALQLGARLLVSGLAAGAYFLRLEGVGIGDPTSSTPSGYSDVASIGDYLISGTITGTAAPLVTPVVVPVISLSLASSAVQEDGAANLVYTFSRSVVSADPLSVNVTLAGTATNGLDYSGLAPGTSVITFAANAATATLVLDPTLDTTVEADETVSLTLAVGTGYSVGTPDAVTGLIVNDDASTRTQAFTAATDSLLASSAADTFQLNRLGDALWSSSPDRITNLQAGMDCIDSPLVRTTAIAPRQLGAVKTLDAAGIGALLTSKAFAKNAAASFSFGSGSSLRTFVALNDGFAGFNAGSDSVLEITGFSGSLSALAIF